MSKSTNNAQTNGNDAEKSYFDQQRALLVRDISLGMEQVLQSVNKLNRSLEGVIAVGNEFSSVEALWSHFENVTVKEEDAGDDNELEGAEQASARQRTSKR